MKEDARLFSIAPPIAPPLIAFLRVEDAGPAQMFESWIVGFNGTFGRRGQSQVHQDRQAVMPPDSEGGPCSRGAASRFSRRCSRTDAQAKTAQDGDRLLSPPILPSHPSFTRPNPHREQLGRDTHLPAAWNACRHWAGLRSPAGGAGHPSYLASRDWR
jgi:hypothetical protein